MGQSQIIDKLGRQLTKLERREFELDEKDVVYFLVEARKMLEHEKTAATFEAIKFYADWAVHTRKDYAPQFIEDMIGKGKSVDEFVSMEYLRNEIIRFLKSHDLPIFLGEESNWKLFWTKLVGILSEQPLTLKIAINRFQFRVSEGAINYEYDEIA
jgi:bifunctional DNA-binding transcriptional regulator/antitoxin component of YhaV-PrlF toxin-antitoxin module